ncbi:cytochrome p450 [Moniliophthora roreri MCA 2997]|uniref:Cytochrome p450 n=1 Tax=Moniliophthora roreri (strain MCA 2997) TaxID=1381753 RepID=V2XUE9_MONRO|nr:cytochrome p450 [Moniliophthora roreri MCA 2997]
MFVSLGTPSSFELVIIGLAATLVFLIFSLLRKSSLDYVPGPSPSRSLFGLEHDLESSNDKPFEKLTKWRAEYGPVYKIPGCFWVRPCQCSRVAQFHGDGLLSAHGKSHQRQRKLLNPAFSTAQLREFLVLFQKATKEARHRSWILFISRGENVVDMADWATRISLDAIGESTFGHTFGAVEGKSDTDNLMKSNRRTHVALRRPSRWDLLARAVRRHIPLSVSLKVFHLFETKESRIFRMAGNVRRVNAVDILSKAKDNDAFNDESKKDILSVILRSYKAEEPNKRMNDEEVIAQTATIIQAGHGTTGTTTSWLIYELANHPEDQMRIVEEIKAVRAKIGFDTEFAVADYDAMPYFNAVIKENLRFHSVISFIARQASCDDTIPLATTIISQTTGKPLTSLPVKKGQRVLLDFESYHKMREVWGEDTNKWNPSRFLDPELRKKQDITVGVFSNLMSFSGGVQGCIGWRFALIEIQTIITSVLERFEISLSPEGLKIVPCRAGVVFPMIEGKLDKGMQIPLIVTKRNLHVD